MEEVSSNQLQIFDFSPSRFSTKVLASTVALILCGTLNTMLFKAQTKDMGLDRRFISVQTFIVFIGQYLNLIIFYTRIIIFPVRRRTHFRKYKNRALMSGRLYEFSTWRVGYASALNCLASLCQMYALVALTPSFYQMLLGSSIIFTPLISYFVLKKRVYKHTMIGIGLSVVSLVLNCVAAWAIGELSGCGGVNGGVAICLMVLGTLLSSAQRVYEEWLLDKVETSAFRFVGLEGFYGVIILSCIHGVALVSNSFTKSDLFNIGLEFVHLASNKWLLISSLILIVSTTFYDLCGIVITRKVSATYRVVNDVARVVLVWLIQIVVYDIHDKSTENKLTYFLVTLLRILSYSLLLFGNVLINEITEVTFWGLDKYFGRYHNEKIDDENFLDESGEFSIMRSINNSNSNR